MPSIMDSMVITLPKCSDPDADPCGAVLRHRVWYGHMADACMLFVGAGLTDVLDGYLARRFNRNLNWGPCWTGRRTSCSLQTP